MSLLYGKLTCNLCLTEYEQPEQSDSVGEMEAAADAAKVLLGKFAPGGCAEEGCCNFR